MRVPEKLVSRVIPTGRRDFKEHQTAWLQQTERLRHRFQIAGGVKGIPIAPESSVLEGGNSNDEIRFYAALRKEECRELRCDDGYKLRVLADNSPILERNDELSTLIKQVSFNPRFLGANHDADFALDIGTVLFKYLSM